MPKTLVLRAQLAEHAELSYGPLVRRLAEILTSPGVASGRVDVVSAGPAGLHPTPSRRACPRPLTPPTYFLALAREAGLCNGGAR